MKNAFNIEKLDRLSSEDLERIAKAVLLALRRRTQKEYDDALDRDERMKEGFSNAESVQIHLDRLDRARAMVYDIEGMPPRHYHR